MNTIPIMHCFDDRYVAPAAVAFLSMLEHASMDFEYRMYVVHEDISTRHQEMLKNVVGRFPNATLEFVTAPSSMDGFFRAMKTQGHYSKEVLYKMNASELFPQYDRMIITDVDCLYLDDISGSWKSFQTDEWNYLAGIGRRGGDEVLPFAKGDEGFENCYAEGFSPEEKDKLRLGVGGGYQIHNFALMRREGVAARMLDTFRQYADRLKQAEQDVINLACAGRILHLPMRNMVCTYLDERLSEAEKTVWRDILDHPVQLHYATSTKPWNAPGSTKAHIWWSYLCRTPFFYEVATRFNMEECRSTWSMFGFLPILKVWHTGAISKIRLLNHIPFKTEF